MEGFIGIDIANNQHDYSGIVIEVSQKMFADMVTIEANKIRRV